MNVAITCLFTRIENPMCPGCDNYPPDPEILHRWVSSIIGAHAVILHDGWIGRDEQAQLREWSPNGHVTTRAITPTDENLFFQRWRHLRAWLDSQPHVDKVFMTDGSDVEMHRPPWDEMKPDMIYCGSENDVVSNKWIVANHPTIKPYAELRPHATLLNAGLLGGSRSVMLRFLGDLLSYAPDSLEDMTDMGAFNRCVWHFWNDCYVTGKQVHTVFNKWEQTGTSWFAHK